MTWKTIVAAAIIVGATALAESAHAQDQAFQNFFTTVCTGSPTGSLATRCGETPGGGGNVSADSEASLNPNQALAGQDAAQDRVRQVTQEIEDRMAARRAEDETAPPIGIIMNARGSWVDRSRTLVSSPLQVAPLQQERGYDGTEWSIQLGGDYRAGENIVVGGLFSYNNSSSEFDSDVSTSPTFTPQGDSGTNDADSYFFTIFGSFAPTESLYVDGSFGGGVSRYDTQRNVVFQVSGAAVPQTNVNARGKPDGFEISSTLGVGYDMQLEALSFGPYLRGRWVRTHVDGFSERGGSGLEMSFSEETRHSLATVLGARASYAISTSFGVLVPHFRAEWEHEYARDAIETEQILVRDGAQNVFRLRGQGPDRDYANVAGGLTAVLPRGFMLFVEYEGLFGFQDVERHRLTGGVRIDLN